MERKKFRFKSRRHIYKNKYGRTEEIYECESCEGCQYKSDCCPEASTNRTIRMMKSLRFIRTRSWTDFSSESGKRILRFLSGAFREGYADNRKRTLPEFDGDNQLL